MEEIKLSRDSSMRVQHLIIIHYRSCAVCFLKELPINISVLWPWVSPPYPHDPWAVGGVFPDFVCWCFGCMNGAWLPVCPLVGAADDLLIFGMHTRIALLR